MVAPYEYDPERWNRYWSAYAYTEMLDIPMKLDVGDMDYVLITAKATIPTFDEPLVREFPLFTMEKGVVQAHSGVNLLERFPLTSGSRRELTITLEVTHYDKAEHLETARTVLQQTSELAKPFANNYPVASQIIGGAKSVLDALIPPEERQMNSHTDTIPYSELGQTRFYVLFRLGQDGAKQHTGKQGASGGWQPTPAGEPTTSAGRNAARTDTERNGGDPDHTFRLVDEAKPCDDKPQAMCKLPASCTAEARTPPDPGLTVASEIVAHMNAGGRLDTYRVRKDLRRLLTKQLQGGDPSSLLKTLDGLPQDYSPPPSYAQPNPDPRAAKNAAAYQTLMIAAETALGALEQFSEKRFNACKTRYQTDRFDAELYVALRFQPSVDVYERSALFPGGSCSEISTSSLKARNDYVSINEFLLHPDDVALAKHSFDLSASYLALRETNKQNDPRKLLTELALQAKQSWTSPGFASDGFAKGAAHVTGCFCQELMNNSIAATAYLLFSLDHPNPACELEPSSPYYFYSSDWAHRFDRRVFLEKRLASLLRSTFQLEEFTPDKPADYWKPVGVAELALLRSDLGEALQQSLQLAANARSCADAESVTDLVSVYCEKCEATLVQKCQGNDDAVAKMRTNFMNRRKDLRENLGAPRLRATQRNLGGY